MMIPKLHNIDIGQQIEIVQYPTFTYAIDFEKGTISKKVDGLPAMEQAIYKMLQTQRYQYAIYDWNYGFEIEDLFGKPRPYVLSELKRRIREALLVDDRIYEVDNFRFEAPSRDVIAVKFTVHTIFGEIDAGGQVMM